MKNYFKVLSALLACGLFSCAVQRGMVPSNFPAFYKEGHRGTRGLMPENTIPAMIEGIKVGANVIEVDVYTSKDGQVFISHDPAVNISHTLTEDGKEISAADAKSMIFHQMNYADIAKFDVGSKYFSAFPQQKKIKAHIPLLSTLIDSVEKFTRDTKRKPVIYNIELKSAENYDGKYNAAPNVLADAVMAVVKSKNIGNRFYIQSFDYRPLKYIHEKYPSVTIGFLTGSKETFDYHITKLGFYPHIYSPHYDLITADLIKQAHGKKLKVVPWTVNTTADINRMKDLGVDGIITDYPNLL